MRKRMHMVEVQDYRYMYKRAFARRKLPMREVVRWGGGRNGLSGPPELLKLFRPRKGSTSTREPWRI